MKVRTTIACALIFPLGICSLLAMAFQRAHDRTPAQDAPTTLTAHDGFEAIPDSAKMTGRPGGADVNGELSNSLATFAGGCFWCMVAPFQQQPGVKHVMSGYTGGHIENPTYQQVVEGSTGHFEAIQVTFDPNICTYTTRSISSGSR